MMLAIIPARGGSKGLPGKNIKLLNGKPLIAYTIEAALQSKLITRVIVSTDDEEIAKVAKNFGAEIPFMRPSILATDEARSIDVFKYTIEELERNQNTINDFIVLQPTSPLRNAQHIDEAITLFKDQNADSVISYCREEHPIFWHKFINDDGSLEDIFTEKYVMNRQEIRTTYYPNGAIYIIKRNLLDKQELTGPKSFAYLMDRNYSADIDTIDDFSFVEYIINTKDNNMRDKS